MSSRRRRAFPGASQLLVALYGSQGRVGEATARLEEAEAKGELRPAARILLGRLQVERGETAKARAIFEEVLRSNTDLPLVESDLAYLLTIDGADLERADELARDAQAALPDEPEVLDTLGYVELRRGNPAAALLYLQRATTLTEESGAPRAVHYYHLGLAHRAAGHNPSAVEAFDRALALEPEFPEAERAREERAQALAGGVPTPPSRGSEGMERTRVHTRARYRKVRGPARSTRKTREASNMPRYSTVVRLGLKGELVIPAALRKKLGLETGQTLAVRAGAEREIVITPAGADSRTLERALRRARSGATARRRDLVDELYQRRRRERDREA